jgi:hypothetical protein
LIISHQPSASASANTRAVHPSHATPEQGRHRAVLVMAAVMAAVMVMVLMVTDDRLSLMVIGSSPRMMYA